LLFNLFYNFNTNAKHLQVISFCDTISFLRKLTSLLERQSSFRRKIMCGIVRKPAKRKHFQNKKSDGSYMMLSKNIVSQIAYLCEETHIPERACGILLDLANTHLTTGEEFVTSQMFAIYKDGKRFVSQQSISDEQDVMHLAMAGSVTHFINQELKTLGLKVVMSHCCGIQMHSLAQENQCMAISHEGNLWRATKLRILKTSDEILLSDEEFLSLYNSQEVLEYT
jgi:hypothetical protein